MRSSRAALPHGLRQRTTRTGTIDVDDDNFFETLVITGATTYGADINIQTVSTQMWISFDGTPVERPFTEKILDSPIPVVAGQDVEITVEISFS